MPHLRAHILPVYVPASGTGEDALMARCANLDPVMLDCCDQCGLCWVRLESLKRILQRCACQCLLSSRFYDHEGVVFLWHVLLYLPCGP